MGKWATFDVAGLAPNVKLTTGGCWEWTGDLDEDGYGVTESGKRVDRLSYTASMGYTGGLNVLHTCDNPACCNPLHLFLSNDKEARVECRPSKLIALLDEFFAPCGDAHLRR